MSEQVNSRSFASYRPFFPPEAISFAEDLYAKSSFVFRVCRPRTTKKGDFRYALLSEQAPVITVNSDLSPYEFLLVYLHEVAHYKVFVRYPRRVKPHGCEWKTEYTSLLSALMEQVALPPEVVTAFSRHIKHPKASSCTDAHLESLFATLRPATAGLLLKDLPAGTLFTFRGEPFRLIHHRRTRAYCLRMSNHRHYLLSVFAQVSLP